MARGAPSRPSPVAVEDVTPLVRARSRLARSTLRIEATTTTRTCASTPVILGIEQRIAASQEGAGAQVILDNEETTLLMVLVCVLSVAPEGVQLKETYGPPIT